VEVLVPKAIVTEGFTWVGTAVGLGVAVGAGSSGLLVESFGANQAFLVATVLALSALLTVARFQLTLSPGSRLDTVDSAQPGHD
ncbi:MAG: MFS transporter, partial [Actinomycetota bacterium]|nr:MFS transporter [Actinomycetota bacterium]